MRLDSIALAAVALAVSAPALHIDVDGDGFPDSVALSHGQLHVVTRSGVLSTKVPRGGVLDGALRVHGLDGVLLLVRFGPKVAVTDAVYRVTGARCSACTSTASRPTRSSAAAAPARSSTSTAGASR
jgi:hypothetical protein